MIDRGDKLSVTRQCALLDLSRSGIYYKPVSQSAQELALMRQIDEIHLANLTRSEEHTSELQSQ